MWRSVLKLLIWMLCLIWAVILADGTLEAPLVVALLVSLSASALSEWSLPRWYASLPCICLFLASMFVPMLIPFIPLSSCDTGLILGGRQRQSELYKNTRLQPKLRLMRWLLYFVWFAAVVTSVIWSDATKLGVHMVVALFSFITFGIGVTLAALSAVKLQLLRAEDSSNDAVRRIHADRLEMETERIRSTRHATLLERTRIAREIHDNVGHLLTRGIMQAHASQVLAQSTTDEQTIQSFQDLENTFVQAMTMVRDAVHDLDEQGNDFSSQIDVAAHCLDLSDTRGTVGTENTSASIEVHLENAIQDAPVAVTRCFVMTIREALNNTARHSSAHHVTIILRNMPALWQLVVQDDGAEIQAAPSNAYPAGISSDEVAYDDSAPSSSELDGVHRERRRPVFMAFGGDSNEGSLRRGMGGMGLADIEERAQQLGGSALCGPYGTGWRVFVSIPKERWQDLVTDQHKPVHQMNTQTDNSHDCSGGAK